jgi:hypothetical protein
LNSEHRFVTQTADTLMHNGPNPGADMTDPETRGQLVRGVSALLDMLVYGEPTDEVLWRGTQVPRDRLDEVTKPGQRIGGSLVSVTPRGDVAQCFAWMNPYGPDAVPVMFKIEAGTRAVHLSPMIEPVERRAGLFYTAREYLTGGQFEVVSAKKVDLEKPVFDMSDGLVDPAESAYYDEPEERETKKGWEVTLRQVEVPAWSRQFELHQDGTIEEPEHPENTLVTQGSRGRSSVRVRPSSSTTPTSRAYPLARLKVASGRTKVVVLGERTFATERRSSRSSLHFRFLSGARRGSASTRGLSA